MSALDPLLMTLAHRLRERRQALGMTQAQLAAEAGVSRRFLGLVESGEGNVSVQRLFAVCTTLSLPLSELFQGMGPASRQTLALIGLRGAGKSTVGHALSQRLKLPFVELDERIQQRAGMSLAEMFEYHGAGYYHEVEEWVLDDVLSAPSRQIVAAGGSVVTSPKSWHRLQEQAQTIWLKASPSSHLERVTAQGDLRPMQGRADALAELEAIWNQRAPLYAQAHRTLDTDQLGVHGVIEQLLKW